MGTGRHPGSHVLLSVKVRQPTRSPAIPATVLDLLAVADDPDPTLQFRERDEVDAGLVAHGHAVDEVRDAPDRPGRELMFFARRPESP